MGDNDLQYFPPHIDKFEHLEVVSERQGAERERETERDRETKRFEWKGRREGREGGKEGGRVLGV